MEKDLDEIVWYFKGKEVGRCYLPEATLGGFRDWLAYNEGISEYDNVNFLKNGEIRMDGADKNSISDELPYGKWAGKQYAERRKSGYFK